MSAQNEITESKKERAAAIIHGYAAAHSFVALALANTVIGDTPILGILTLTMLSDLGNLFGIKKSTFEIFKNLLQMFAAQLGGYLAAKGLTWIPWAGNLMNAGIAFGMAETIGWSVFHLYSDGKTLETATKEDISKAKKKARADRMDYEDYKEKIDALPESVREDYERLGRKLAESHLSEEEKQEIARAMKEVLVKHL